MAERIADKQSLWSGKMPLTLFFPNSSVDVLSQEGGCFWQTIQFGGPSNLVRRGLDGPCVTTGSQAQSGGSQRVTSQSNLFPKNFRHQALTILQQSPELGS